MDWGSFIICGRRKGEPLKCPVESPRKDCEQVYKAILQNVEQGLDELPIKLKFGPEVTFEVLAKSGAS